MESACKSTAGGCAGFCGITDNRGAEFSGGFNRKAESDAGSCIFY